jgi:hypothetical protein
MTAVLISSGTEKPENSSGGKEKTSVDAAADLITLNQRFKWDGCLYFRLFALRRTCATAFRYATPKL